MVIKGGKISFKTSNKGTTITNMALTKLPVKMEKGEDEKTRTQKVKVKGSFLL